MEKVITQDGSVTYYNEQVHDYYHSKSGARQEAIEKHVRALDLQPGKIIFDMCFGLGYNSAAALDLGPSTIFCFENDKEILKKILVTDADFKSYMHIKNFVKGFLEGINIYENNGIRLIMIFGDCRDKIKEIDKKADYVFFDPFSPEKVPEMWTESFFRDIKDKMNKNGKLSTYSYARSVKENLSKAGFAVEDGPVVGRRSPSTIAVLKV
jgi:predicted methyltransferase|tara:strand:- start:142 stop:771 length:630 start_codon:yes stop_codon:yes gene_type:complete